MTRELPALSAVERSALLTVISRAGDAEWRTPILGDTWSCDVRDRLAVDWEGMGMPKKEAFTVAIRGSILDEVCRRFIARHPDACVIELGSGLDDRVLRVDPPASTTWIDVDFPAVHALRRELGFPPQSANRVEAATDAIDEEWLRMLPAGRSMVVIADGFFPFLPERSAAALVHRIVDRSASGELLMNGYSTLARKLMPRVRAIRDLGLDIAGGTAFDDPVQPESWHPRIRFAEQRMLTASPSVPRMPVGLRATIRVMRWFPALARRSDVGVLRYTF
jgi:O-methyltransferase involved in polyketide biosynthesis